MKKTNNKSLGKKVCKKPKSRKLPTSSGLPHFAYGGVAMDIDSPAKQIFDINRMAEEASIEAANDPTVLGLKALSSALMSTGTNMIGSGFSQGAKLKDAGKFGDFINKNAGTVSKGLAASSGLLNIMAEGGTVKGDVEVEGNEAFETPMGQFGMFEGPSHEAGGVNLNLTDPNSIIFDGHVPQGTFIYPKRLKVAGRSMSKRAEDRNKKESKLKKLLKNSSDNILKNTLNRTQEVNQNEDAVDRAFIQAHKNLKENKNQKFADGSYLPLDDDSEFGIQYDEVGNPIVNWMKNAMATAQTSTTTNSKAGTTKKSFSDMIDTAGLPTFGDALGMAGNLFQGIMPLRTTLKQRKADTPNINPYAHYGEEALNTLEQNKALQNYIKDDQMKESELGRASTINRNAQSTRGINTLRAMNLATDAMYNQNVTDILSKYAASLSGINDRISATQLDISGKKVEGEKYRDLSDRQDRDAFYTALGKSYETLGEGISRTGKSINDIKQRGVQSKLMNDIYENVKTNVMNGTISQKDGIANNANPISIQFENYLNTILKPEQIKNLTMDQRMAYYNAWALSAMTNKLGQ